ncbi:ATP-dependent bile acid permease [Leucoagaricus sp. SymC.cos]|nr:ATP-dependent bile acid permease [Leucoagaricus sp. SymC.cos]
MSLCDDKGPFDFGDPCVRASWGALVPGAFVFALCVFSIPVPAFIRRLFEPITRQLRTYLTLPEAEALDDQGLAGEKEVEEGEEAGVVHSSQSIPLWRTVIFVFIGIVETLYWSAHGSYLLYDDKANWWRGTRALIYAVAWLYTVVKPVLRPKATPPFDMFVVYLLLLAAGVLELGGYLYDHTVFDVPLPNKYVLTAVITEVVAVTALLIVVCGMPLAIPSERVKKGDVGRTITMEDYTSLFGWITFYWVYPLVRKGRSTTLNEEDVWDLSPTLQSRPIFVKFSQTKRPTLLRRIWAANSLDLILDFTFTLVSVVFNYAGPFFLKQILDEISHETTSRASRSKAYVYAFLAFFCTLAKAQADVQHLWFGRRASTRIRSELMAAIYEKALKRKDYSGIIDKNKIEKPDEEKTGEDGHRKKKSKAKKKAEKEQAAKADDPKAGADVGKIVNLMAGDANRASSRFHSPPINEKLITAQISQMVSGFYFLYGAPFEIAIAGTMLYKLLGWSAFAGFIVLLVGWPLNNILSRRSVRIQKGVLAARDKRMGVLNELIGAVKFIKFFAWEDRWIDRAMDARQNELRWMVKARLNSVMFYFLWSCAPILVSITSFFVYVLQGHVLDVSTAFTAIALFGMIRLPLNIIPTYIIQILQSRVALERISVYLDEDEVSEQVSALKKDRSSPPATGTSAEENGLGFIDASFGWNKIPDDRDKSEDTASGAANGKAREPSSSSTVMEDTASTIASETGDVSSIAIDFTAPDDEDRRFELKDLNIRFPEGELTIVTGSTASGKTALLMALLGEMTTVSGRIIMRKEPSQIDENGFMHSISYAAQSPWLRHQSIKDNILFGYPLDEERYEAVIEACALRPDLEMLEDGDQTEIGARRGVSLSGGQKARVALARAVYARTKYVLLDDPLSAVDSHTSRFLYEHLLQGPLLANRTVILVTHHVELVLPGAYYLVRMLDGRIDTHGTIKDLRARSVLDNIKHDVEAEAKKEETVIATEGTVEGEEAVKSDEADATDAKKDASLTKKPRKLVKAEHRETGSVKWAIYKSYLKASSYWTWIVLGALIVVTQLLGVGEKFWVKIWGEAYGEPDGQIPPHYAFRSFGAIEQEIPMDGYPASHHQHHYQMLPRTFTIGSLDIQWPDAMTHPYFYIGIYAAIGLGTALTNVLSVAAQYTGALRASRILFKKLLVNVVRATFRFHDTTPQGRMLNRFGKACIVFPGFLIPAFFIGLGYYQLAIGYLNTGRDLRRMESNSRSPIFSDFGELLEGIVTVRAFSAEVRFLNNLHKKIDVTTKMWYTFWMTNRWLLLNFDTLGGLAVLVTTLFSIATLTGGAGLAGVCITSSMAFTMSVYWACRFWTALELDLNSVERVVEYLELPQEPPAIIESNRVPAYWPSSSNNASLISVENLTIKYAPELPAVLHDVSFTLKSGERVGLLGRTGSGKSTLAMSILRFVDPAEGKIVIDGIDISTIGIQDLRSRLVSLIDTFIPQDATLFSGTLRDNLDPFNDHTDAECLEVLERVQMIGKSPGSVSRDRSAFTSPTGSRTPSVHNVSITPSTSDTDNASSIITSTSTPTEVDSGKTKITLDTQVSAGGTNFSQGQRQLIAMARALLRRSSIIVLDEATSSIDFATDAKIQQTIREEFTDSLLLTVAHRLKTVIDYDRLVVLDKGQVAEIGTPYELIQKEDGIFRNMCLKSGSFTELEATARAKAEGLAATAQS